MSNKGKKWCHLSNCYDSKFLIWQNTKFIIVIVAFFRKEWEKSEVERNMDQVNVAIADDNERMLELLGNIISSDQELSLGRLKCYHENPLSDCGQETSDDGK